MRYVRIILVFAFLVVIYVQAVKADPRFEFGNDVFVPGGKDRYLSNVVGFATTLKRDPAKKVDKGVLGIWNEMRTPDDLRKKVLDEKDAPYSGYTYIAYMNRQKAEVGDYREYEYRVGLLGNLSGAKAMQRFIHDDLDLGAYPEWVGQSPNEVAAEFIYSHNKITPIESILGDTIAINRYGVRVGNVINEIFLKQTIEKKFWRLKGIASMEGHLQANNRHYEGSLIRSNSETHTVPIQNFWSSASLGVETKVGILDSEYAIGMAYTYETRQFEAQDADHIYASIYVKAGW